MCSICSGFGRFSCQPMEHGVSCHYRSWIDCVSERGREALPTSAGGLLPGKRGAWCLPVRIVAGGPWRLSRGALVGLGHRVEAELRRGLLFQQRKRLRRVGETLCPFGTRPERGRRGGRRACRRLDLDAAATHEAPERREALRQHHVASLASRALDAYAKRGGAADGFIEGFGATRIAPGESAVGSGAHVPATFVGLGSFAVMRIKPRIDAVLPLTLRVDRESPVRPSFSRRTAHRHAKRRLFASARAGTWAGTRSGARTV